MSLRAATASALLLLAGRAAGGDVFPGRGGESGLLDVPLAETTPVGTGAVSSELSVSRVPGTIGARVSPFPLALVTGLGERVEAGVSLRQGGRPGDPRPSPTLFSGGLKLHLADAGELAPGLALGLYADRVNATAGYGARAIASTRRLGAVRLSAFAGAELRGTGGAGPTGGAAVELGLTPRVDLVADALLTRDGPMAGAALQWQLSRLFGLSVGGDWLPRDGGFRLTVGFAVAARPKRRAAPVEPAKKPEPVAEAAPAAPSGPRFEGPRPRFKMKIAQGTAQPRKQHYAYSGAAPAEAGKRRGPRIDPAEQLRRELADRSAAQDARERRLRSSDAALAGRHDRLVALREALGNRETVLVRRAALLDEREGGLRVSGSAGVRELQLAEAEDHLRGAEREAERQEKLHRATAEAAEAREREARQAEAAAPAPAVDDAAAADARDARLDALEKRLQTTRDALEASDATLTAAATRVDALERRLSLKGDRLALTERRGRDAARGTAGLDPRPVSAVVQAPSAVTAPGAPAESATGALVAGETGRRQLREGVAGYQADLERCVGAELARRALVRSEGVLHLRVAADGAVQGVGYESEQGGAIVDDCLGAAAQRWRLPRAAAAYAADVPVLVIVGVAR